MAPRLTDTMSPLGSVGLAGISTGYITDEPMARLRGSKGMELYREMADNDPVLGAVLFAMEMLLRQVEWRIEPTSNPDVSPADAEAAAQFARECLFFDMETPFSDVVSEVTTMLTYGYALHEIVLKRRSGDRGAVRSRFNDGAIGIRGLYARAQETLEKWTVTQDGMVLGVEQWTDEAPAVYLPVERLLHWRTTSRRNNPEGRSVLRTAVVSYLRKKSLEEAEGRAIVRMPGIVDVRIPGRFMVASASEAEKAVFASYRAMAEAIGRDKQGAVVLPSDSDGNGQRAYDLKFVRAEGDLKIGDIHQTITRYDQRMATSVLADFVLLGQAAVGSFALSSDKTALFAAALGGFVRAIAMPFNEVLLPMLWRHNGRDMATLPVLAHGDIESPNLAELGDYVTKLAGAGVALFPDDKLENSLRAAARLPAKDQNAQPQADDLDDEDPEDA